MNSRELNGERNGVGSTARPIGHTALLIARQTAFSTEIKGYLEEFGCQVAEADSTRDMLSLIKSRQPYLVLLDAGGLPPAVEEGLSRVVENLKNNPYTGSVPVVIVSASSVSEESQLELFRQGADDYLVRPASAELFRVRLRAVCRRYSPVDEQADALRAEDLVLDAKARKVTVDGSPVALTRKEFDLLNTLLRKRGVVVYTAHLYHTVWGYGESAPVDSHTVKVHISSLRGKLGPRLGGKIVNLPSLGYRFED